MISKELLSEVLEEEVLSVRPYISDDPFYKNIIMWECRKNTYDIINIYELAHKCKEWAFNNGYYLTIYNDAVDIILQTNCKLIENITDDSFKYSPMLVFKACQWILDNKEGI